MPRLDTLRTAYVLTAVSRRADRHLPAISRLSAAPTICSRSDGRARRRVQGPERVRAVSDLAGADRARAHADGAHSACATCVVLGISSVRLVPELLARRLVSFRGVGGGDDRRSLFLTAPTPMRCAFALSRSTAATLALLARAAGVVLLSFDVDRSHVSANASISFNSYDVGQGGRFRLQELALGAMLQFPNGMGPFEFARVYGLQQHNVYLQAFLVYGWIGGMSLYPVAGSPRIMVGLRSALVRDAVAALPHRRLRRLRRRGAAKAS